ncbi:hypothetical protein SAMN05216420_101110 [Nitrosospira sp. Nl5]|uniref:hypothetical protein n=1 Tax=Nitrosospira sp. Nl5 TaxID=200120 RepID=UPI00088AF966|nr:hypothetical protein [Nitrosospira sp. Nl5]SCX85465.1 hypothetical protein SAMN05216420_101110 [Nitrosospira sp. Nl5]
MDSTSGPGLFIRERDRILPATAEDEEVARSYPMFPDKGPITHGYRITILTRNIMVSAGDCVRIIHICEAVIPHLLLYIMGPKPIYDEYVNDVLSTPALPVHENPLAPSFYDGRTAVGPAIDYNYEITQYRFEKPGTYLLQWRPGTLVSNTLRIQVAAEKTGGPAAVRET